MESKNKQISDETRMRIQKVSKEDMENQFYCGYPEWRLDGYKGMNEIVKTIFGTKFDEFEHATNEQKINMLVNQLYSNSEEHTPIDQLALFTKIRMILAQ